LEGETEGMIVDGSREEVVSIFEVVAVEIELESVDMVVVVISVVDDEELVSVWVIMVEDVADDDFEAAEEEPDPAEMVINVEVKTDPVRVLFVVNVDTTAATVDDCDLMVPLDEEDGMTNVDGDREVVIVVVVMVFTVELVVDVSGKRIKVDKLLLISFQQ